MRLLGQDCGCDNRKEIMFTKGQLGVTEAAILGGVALVIIVAWKANRG